MISKLQLRAVTVAACLPVALSCAHRPPPSSPPLAFPDSQAFAEVRSRAYGLMVRDLDGDQLDDAVVALEVAGGWAPAAFFHTVDDEGNHRWRATCQGPAVVGSELSGLAWVEMTGGPLVLMLGDEENPDELIQTVLLVDPMEACAARLEDRMVLVKPAGDVIAPGPIPAGASLRDEALVLTDRPDTVTLEGPAGASSLLRSVRIRRVFGTREVVEVDEATASFLVARELAVTWQGNGEPMTLEMLTDGDDVTAFAARADESGTLRLRADGDIVLVVVHHGCSGDDEPRLSLRAGTGEPWLLGSPVPPESFVRAAGRSRDQGGVRRDLVALRTPTAELVFGLGPVEQARCIREVRAYGFNSAAN